MNQSPAVSSVLQRFFRFRLVTLLALMVPVGFASLWIGALIDKRPIDWVPYSKASLNKHINNNKTVLVYFGAEWDLNSKYVEKKSLEARRIRRLIRSRGVIAMRVDFTERSREAVDALNSVDRNTTPVVAIYTTESPSQPIIFDSLIREPELFEALTTATRR